MTTVATTSTDICNLALTYLGENRIADINDSDTVARDCAAVYDYERQALLREYPWNFATTMAALTPVAASDSFGLEYAYEFPDNFRALGALDIGVYDWMLQHKAIRTNKPTELRIIYIRDIDFIPSFDSTFVPTLALKIAIALCDRITQSNTKLDQLDRRYRTTLNKALMANSREKNLKLEFSSSWVEVMAGTLHPLVRR